MKNKKTTEVVEKLINILENNNENIDKWLNTVAIKNPYRALEIYIKIAQMVLPKTIQDDKEEIKKPPKIVFRRFD